MRELIGLKIVDSLDKKIEYGSTLLRARVHGRPYAFSAILVTRLGSDKTEANLVGLGTLLAERTVCLVGHGAGTDG